MKDNYIIEKDNILRDSTELELDYINFLESNPIHTIQRWLLTRTKEEITSMAEQMEEMFSNPHTQNQSLLPMLTLIAKGNKKFNEEKYLKALNETMIAVSMIDLVHKGFLTYKIAEKDEDWTFSPTDRLDKLRDEFDGEEITPERLEEELEKDYDPED